jgi:hypothetical protein
MDNTSIGKIQKTLKSSTPVIIKSDDTSQFIRENYGTKYINDISDSDNDDRMSYRKKNNDVINKLSGKNNSNIKPKLTDETLSKRTMSIKNPPSRANIKEKIKENDSDNSQYLGSEESGDDGDSYISIEEYEFKEDFEKQVKTYVKTDDRIKELQKEIKELNTSKKISEDAIMKHLERLGETDIKITGGKLIVNKNRAKASLKEDFIKEALTEKIKDPKIIEDIFEKIEEKREENAKILDKLKRTNGNKKK